MLVEEGLQELDDGGFAEGGAAVAGAGEGLEPDGHALCLQRGFKLQALRIGHEGVVRAVQDEEGRAVFADVVHGAHGIGLRFVVELGADERGVGIARCVEGEDVLHVFVLGSLLHDGAEIGGAVNVNHGLHAIGLIQMAADGWKGLFATGSADERGEMTTRGTTDGTEVISVEVVLLRVRPQPANGGLAVLNLRRKDGFLAETILYARHGIAFEHHRGNGAREFVSRTPSAAVNVHDEWQRFIRRFLREVDVELLRLITAFDVGDVLLEFDARRQLSAEGGGEKSKKEQERFHAKPRRCR